MPRTYVVSNYLTAADVALYGALHPVFVSFYALSVEIEILKCSDETFSSPTILSSIGDTLF